MADEVYVDTPRTCDNPWNRHPEARTAAYDAKTKSGRWGNLCADCFTAGGIGLGTGKGQRLILGPKPHPDPDSLRTRIHMAIAAGDLSTAEDLTTELSGDADGLDEFL